MSANRILFEFKGGIVGSKQVKGIRKSLYNWAQNHIGYYHPKKKPFLYQDNNMTVDIVFETKKSALKFQNDFESISTHVSNSELETNSEIVLIDFFPLTERILLKDYKADETDSPPDSFLTRSEFTEYHTTDDIVLYQSIENEIWLKFGSEGAHLIPSHICRKRKLFQLDKSENNRLALSRQLHGYVDGLSNGNRPVVKLNYVPSKEEVVDGRYRVVIGVECFDEDVKALVVPMLKPGCRATSNPLIMNCDVFVRDKEEFIHSLKFKSQETEKIWQELNSL